MSSRNMDRYAAMRPYFEVVAEGLKGLVDGTDFFDMHAEDVVVEYIITVPEYPRRIVGREALAELYSDYGNSIVQSDSSEVRRQPIHLGDHGQGPQDRAVARLPGSSGGVRGIRQRTGARLTYRPYRRSVSDIAISS